MLLLRDLAKRQWYGSPTTSNGSESGFYSNTAEIIKYAILVAIVLIVALWVVGGMAHARRRIRQGKPLLFYHGWMYRMSHRSPVIRNGIVTSRYSVSHPLQDFSREAPPPPAYNHHDVPPAYQPPPNDKSEFHNIYINSIRDEQGPVPRDQGASVSRPEPVAVPQGSGRWQ